MKRWHHFLTHEWRAKLSSLVLATLLWLLIRHSIGYSSAPPVSPPPVQSVPAESHE